MYRDFFMLSVKGIRGKGIRSWLTMVGIVIGIAAIVSLISLGEGLQNAMNDQFSLLGPNLIYVYPGDIFGTVTSSAVLTDRELDIISGVRGVDIAGGFISKLGRIKYRDEVNYAFIIGFDTGELQDVWFDSGGLKVQEGRKLRSGDDNKILIGYSYWAGKIFKRPVREGEKLELEGRNFEVVGEISRVGNSADDSQVYISLDAAKSLFDLEDEYIVITARVKDGYDVKKVAEKINEDLRRDRGLKEGEEDYTVMTMDEMREVVSVVLDSVQAVVVGIALISLIVGGVGIMNTMYTSVLERTREIGVMKAVGARNESILALFMVESGIIGTVGGLVGIILGAGLSKAIELYAVEQLDQVIIQAAVTPQLVLGALLFSFTVGVISGILPARQASKLSPVDALRYE